MADKSISELNPATAVGATDLFVLQQAGTAKKLTGQTLENWLVSFADGHGGIQTLEKTSTTGTDPVVDTYTITYADETTSTFTVTNGIKGDTGAQTYVHVKYSAVQPTRDADIGDIPDEWMGIYIGLASAAPTHYTDYTWNKVRGEKGDTGDAAEITSQSVQYQASNNGTIVPTGTWSNSIPSVSEGQYLWTRTIVTYNSGTTTTAYSVGYKGINGTGAGDMIKSAYDPQGSVEAAGGIPSYVGGQVPSAAQQNPQMDGQANVGSSSDYARADHKHPSDTSRASKTEVSALRIGRVSVKGYRYHVDRVNGNDNDTGYSGHAWKTLDRFFDEANRLTGDTGDIRCYLDTPGTYVVGNSTEASKTFTGVAIHITGGTTVPSSYDGGNYVISFQNTGETKFYESHLNLQNVKVLCPNSTVTNPFAFDGGGYYINYSEIVPQLSISGCTAIVTDTICKNIGISSSKVILNSVKTTATTGNQITISNGSDVTYTGSISTGNLLATNTSAAFRCTNSRLCLTQAYPSTLNTPSLYIVNSNIVISKARISSWLAKIDAADTNSVWSISATYVGGDSYSCSNAILPVIFTGGAKSIHFGVPLPKEISASSVTVNTLKGAIRMPLGGYLSDGSTASSASDWLNGTNIASINANIVENVIYIAIVCTDIPTYGGTAITNNSCAVFEGTVNVTFS